MVSAKHTRSIHIDAPVEKVFGYLEEPAHFIGMTMGPEKYQATVVAVNRTPDGLVATYECKYREFGMHLTAVLTREEYVPNERIADRSSYGPVFTVDVEAEAAGTRLTIGWDASKFMKMLDAVFMHSDKDLDPALAHIKKEVEALP